jgi:O-antigen ligase
VTHPSIAAQTPSGTGRAERVAFFFAAVFLFTAPFAASGGVRQTSLIVATLAVILSGRWRDALAIAPRAPLVAIALWFLLAPASLAWSIDVNHTLEELRAETLYGSLAFVLFFAVARGDASWRRWWLAIFAGTALTLAAKVFQDASGIRLSRHSPDGGVGPYSTHLVLVAPLLLAIVYPRPWGFARNAWIFAISLGAVFAAAWLTHEAWTTPNRIVWPSLAVAFLVAAAANANAAGPGLGAVAGLRRVAVVCGVALALAFAASIAAKSERYYRDDENLAASLEHDLRPKLWGVGWEQFKSAPWLGHGFGREILAPAFIPETPVGVNHPQLRHAHNMLLNVALQLGVVGLALFLGVLFTFAREYARFLADPVLAPLGVIGLAILAGFMTKNLTDDFLHRHNAQVFWALNGMLLGLGAHTRR